MALSKLSEYSPKVQNGEYPIVLSPIHFHGDTIFCCTYQNQPYTPMKPIVENMGLMGVPIPEAITKAVEILKKKSETEDKNGGKE